MRVGGGWESSRCPRYAGEVVTSPYPLTQKQKDRENSWGVETLYLVPLEDLKKLAYLEGKRSLVDDFAAWMTACQILVPHRWGE